MGGEISNSLKNMIQVLTAKHKSITFDTTPDFKKKINEDHKEYDKSTVMAEKRAGVQQKL